MNEEKDPALTFGFVGLAIFIVLAVIFVYFAISAFEAPTGGFSPGG